MKERKRKKSRFLPIFWVGVVKKLNWVVKKFNWGG